MPIPPSADTFHKTPSMNWSEFFNMGGYAFYVWTSYGLMAIVLLLNIWLPIRRRADVERRIRRLNAQTGKQT